MTLLLLSLAWAFAWIGYGIHPRCAIAPGPLIFIASGPLMPVVAAALLADAYRQHRQYRRYHSAPKRNLARDWVI